MAARLVYPATRRAATSYMKHGVTVPEPYGFLEDPNSDETKDFVTKQNELFQSYVSAFQHRGQLRETIGKLQNYPRTSAFSRRGDWFYYYHNTGLQNQSVLYRAKAIDAEATSEVFLDPNTFSADGTSAIGASAWSDSQRYFAYGINEKGSDWAKIHVKDSDSSAPLTDCIEWVKFSGIAWLEDKGFFYTRFPALVGAASADKGTETDKAENCFLCYHRLGTPQSEDVKVLDLPERPQWLIGSTVSDCNKYLIVTIHDGCEQKNLLWVADLPDDSPETLRHLKFNKLVSEWVGEYDYLGNNDAVFYFSTNTNAPKKKVTAVDLKTNEWREVVREESDVLDYVALVRNTLLLVYLKDAKHVMTSRLLSDPPGAPSKQINLPIGTVAALAARRNSNFVCVKITSFLLPGRSLYFDIDRLDEITVARDDTLQDFNPDVFETSQVFYDSKDGSVKIPMFIVRRKGPVDPSTPTLLYGYGGFNISITPSFSATRIAFLKHLRGTLCIANIRGGGEYGIEWHNAGRLKNKQNCFDDFVQAAKYLHASGYSTPSSLAIMGGSNGGMLVAACANQAPHLFGAVVAQVGVMDALKFHQFTIGHAWTSDFGNPEVEGDFHVTLKYSPLHNIKTNTKYPAILCCTGDHDDRVVPLHTHKYLASLQHANPEGSVFLGRIEVAAGHGAGKPISKIVDEAADTYAFIATALKSAWVD